MKFKSLIYLFALTPIFALAEEIKEENEEENTTWVDEQHTVVSNTLDEWANDINDWLGETDPNKPASASIRIMLDGQWNKYDKFSYKPRIRGKIKLPVLKKRLNIVFGDDELDNELRDKNHVDKMYKDNESRQGYNAKEARDSNSSIALRWTDQIKALGIKTELDGGIRSGSDIYGRLRFSKEWHITEQFGTRIEQIYRYGSESKHYLRSNFVNKYQQNETTAIINHTHFEYRHDVDEERSWGNSLYRQHNFKPLASFSYGLAVGGRLDKDLSRINHWGPFINYRQSILRKWLFIQPELSFYNNKDNDRNHTIGAFLRLEAVF